MADELLKRFGTEPESVEKLAAAERVLGIHGVSITGRATTAPASTAWRSSIAAIFPVHETPSRRDPLHRTVELPKPVKQENADAFNALFGRG